ncbi:MAG: flippase-like domain-containing protein [Gemmatimonadetes bacterium]|nr:flippase-like domain-containing protein [Gemmatimonadota bacterium]
MTRLPKPLVIAIQVAFGTAVVWYAGRELVKQWHQAGESLRAIDVRWSLVAGSCLLVLAAYGVLIQTWRLTLGVWNARLPGWVAARIWFVSNLGRYIPGKIWQISAMGVMTHQQGVSAIAATSSSIMVNLINIVSGCLVVFATGAGVLDVAAPSGRAAAAILVVLAVAALFFAPAIISWLARRAEGVTGRAVSLPTSLTPGVVILGLLGTAVAWVLYGLAFQMFAVGVLGSAIHGNSADYIAAYAASYLVGYLTLIAPGGLGVREAMLVIALGVAGVATEPNGWILALSSRLWLTVLEILPGTLFLLAGDRLRLRENDASS